MVLTSRAESEPDENGLTLLNIVSPGFAECVSPNRGQSHRGLDTDSSRDCNRGALTLSSMALAGFGLKRRGSRNAIINGALSGVPGGLINAELHSLLQNGELADKEQLTQAVVTMSVVGAGFGGWHHYKSKYNIDRQHFNCISAETRLLRERVLESESLKKRLGP